MCGRYSLFTDQEIVEINKIVAETGKKYNGEISTLMKTGEIFPTNTAPILVENGSGVTPDLSVWGFPSFRGKGVIINARSETAEEKPMFRKCLQDRRCVVPSTGFYEWDRSKQKYLFRRPGTPVVYLAGIYQIFKEEQRFAILTADANSSMEDIHDRMPVILMPNQIQDWLMDTPRAYTLLHQIPPPLERQAVS